MDDNMYVKQFKYSKKKSVITRKSTAVLMQWHYRFGHANFEVMRQMNRAQSVKGMTLITNDDAKQMGCVACTFAKMKQMPYRNTHANRATSPFDRALMDVTFVSGVQTPSGHTCMRLAHHR